MKFEINKERNKLTVAADKCERELIKQMVADGVNIHSDAAMVDLFETMVVNSELTWVDPSETGDLTSAPMLGLRDQDWNVTERWAFMDYQVKSVLETLCDNGSAVFVC